MRDSVEQVMKPLIEMEDKDFARLFSELGDNPFLAVMGALQPEDREKLLLKLPNRISERLRDEFLLRSCPHTIFVNEALEEISLKIMELAKYGFIDAPADVLSLPLMERLLTKKENATKIESLEGKIEQLTLALNAMLNKSNATAL